jgi:hypothetical protein
MAAAEVVAPTAGTVIRVAGSEKRPVRDLVIRGLTLSATTPPLTAGGFGAGRFDGALSVEWGERCRFDRLEIRNVGGHGIKAAGTGLRIRACHVHHTGAGGILFGGDRAGVEDNHVHDIGLLFPSGIALWGTGRKVSRARIAHNEIHDTPYTGIACGGEDNRITDNLIARVMQQLHDGAAIYITFCKRIAIRRNVVRDIIDTGGYGASAYYLDEQAESCVVEQNLSLNVATPSHNHMARQNTIRNNVFVAGGDVTLSFPRSAEYRFEKNVIEAGGRIVFRNPGAMVTVRGNVLHSAGGDVVGVDLHDYRETGVKPVDGQRGLILADARVRIRRDGTVAFSRGSPAVRLGIAPVDVGRAGRVPPSP